MRRAPVFALAAMLCGCFDIAPAPGPLLPIDYGLLSDANLGPRPDRGFVEDAAPLPDFDAAPTSCEGDIDCAPARFCQRGACIEGCRLDPDNCAPEGGRPSACDPVPRACRLEVPCCADNGCSLVFEGTCAGTVPNANDCRDDPCTTRCATDRQCPVGTWCRTSDQRCLEGCRLDDPAACPRAESCSSGTHDCGPRACAGDDDCPDFQLCDDGVCSLPCAGDEDCGAERRCEDDGRCGEAFDCEDDAREPDDLAADATVVRLERAGGQARARVDGGVICGRDADVYALDLLQGERFRVDLETDGPLGLRVTGERLEAPIEGEARVEYPAAGAAVPAGRYLVQVGADTPDLRTPYALQIAVAPAVPGCFPDAREPDDAPAQAFRGAGDETGYTGTLCGSPDWFVVHVSPDDGIEVQVDAVAGTPRMLVDLFAEGDLDRAPSFQLPAQVIGNTVRHSFRVAPANGAFGDEDWYLRVRPADEASAVEYRARMQVLVPSAVCSADEAERAERNDRGENATSLPVVSAGQRFVADGLLCSSPEDVDWYRFDIAQAGSRVCVMVQAEDDTLGADLDLALYPAQAQGADICLFDVQCGEGAACLDGRCTAAIATSASELGVEMIARSRGGDLPGRRLVRVSRARIGPEQGYRVAVSVTPPAPCQPDWQERGRLNDDPVLATPLGAGGTAICDAWICQDERVGGDWYGIDLPAGEDRTVFVRFDRARDGALRLDVSGQAMAAAAVPEGDVQCVNLRGGASDGMALVRVGADSFAPDQDRVDYALRVVPTDLGIRPTGACAVLGGSPLPACTPDNVDGDACWPTVDVTVDP